MTFQIAVAIGDNNDEYLCERTTSLRTAVHCRRYSQNQINDLSICTLTNTENTRDTIAIKSILSENFLYVLPNMWSYSCCSRYSRIGLSNFRYRNWNTDIDTIYRVQSEPISNLSTACKYHPVTSHCSVVPSRLFSSIFPCCLMLVAPCKTTCGKCSSFIFTTWPKY